MRFLIRWAIRFFIVGIALIVALVLLKDVLLKAFAEYSLRTQTGLDVRIGRLELGLGSPRLTMEDFKIYNPAEFGGSPLVDAPELHVECDAGALAWKELRIKLLRLNLSEVNLVESRDGKTNLTVFLERLQQRSADVPGGTNRVFGMKFQGIDTLNLTVGKVICSSMKNPGRDVAFEVGLKNEVLSNVKSVNDLTNLLFKVFFRRGINFSNNGTGTVLHLLQGGSPTTPEGKPPLSREVPPTAKGAAVPKPVPAK